MLLAVGMFGFHSFPGKNVKPERKMTAMKSGFSGVTQAFRFSPTSVGAGSTRPFVRGRGILGRGTNERIRFFDLPRRAIRKKQNPVGEM